MLALWIMASTSPFNNVIRNVARFFVSYWSQAQEIFYNKFSQAQYTSISLDATGPFFKKIQPPVDSSQLQTVKHLFLYIAILKLQTTSVPLTQMISATRWAIYLGG